jgi:DNA-binding transcriptional LysR family regulator
VTPPAARTLVPCLLRQFAIQAPLVSVEVQKMWRPDLDAALDDGSIDAAIILGVDNARKGRRSQVLWSQSLVIGVRSDHRYARRSSIALWELSSETLGLASPDLFPAWAQIQRMALALIFHQVA